MNKTAITTHVLDLDSGKPAADMQVFLFSTPSTAPMASAITDMDGRILIWDAPIKLNYGIYRLRFSVGNWFMQHGRKVFYPEINISFNVTDTEGHYHIPLLLNAHGYSTYRGS